jgi:subtilisin family serine protease
MGPEGARTGATVAAGIRWAVQHRAQVINVSIGDVDERPVAIALAQARDVVVVVAAGNVEQTGATVQTLAINRLIRTAKDHGPPGRDPQYGFGTLVLRSWSPGQASFSRARSSRRRILPVTVFGSSSTISTLRGYL